MRAIIGSTRNMRNALRNSVVPKAATSARDCRRTAGASEAMRRRGPALDTPIEDMGAHRRHKNHGTADSHPTTTYGTRRGRPETILKPTYGIVRDGGQRRRIRDGDHGDYGE